MSDPIRQSLQIEQERADVWKSRAETAESWHWKAASLLAEISRRQSLPFDLNTQLRELLKWEPEPFKRDVIADDDGDEL